MGWVFRSGSWLKEKGERTLSIDDSSFMSKPVRKRYGPRFRVWMEASNWTFPLLIRCYIIVLVLDADGRLSK